MSRSLAREFALQLLYQLDTYPDDAEWQIEAFLIERMGAEPTASYMEAQGDFLKKEKDMNPVQKQETATPRVYRRMRRNVDDLQPSADESLPLNPKEKPWDAYLPISDDPKQQARIRGGMLTYVEQLAREVHKLRPQLDLYYAPYLRSWTPSRLPRIDRSILRLATYELYYAVDVPLAVAIDEAVKLAKKFAGEEAHVYINGVLGKMMQEQPTPPEDEMEPIVAPPILYEEEGDASES